MIPVIETLKGALEKKEDHLVVTQDIRDLTEQIPSLATDTATCEKLHLLRDALDKRLPEMKGKEYDTQLDKLERRAAWKNLRDALRDNDIVGNLPLQDLLPENMRPYAKKAYGRVDKLADHVENNASGYAAGIAGLTVAGGVVYGLYKLRGIAKSAGKVFMNALKVVVLALGGAAVIKGINHVAPEFFPKIGGKLEEAWKKVQEYFGKDPNAAPATPANPPAAPGNPPVAPPNGPQPPQAPPGFKIDAPKGQDLLGRDISVELKGNKMTVQVSADGITVDGKLYKIATTLTPEEKEKLQRNFWPYPGLTVDGDETGVTFQKVFWDNKKLALTGSISGKKSNGTPGTFSRVKEVPVADLLDALTQLSENPGTVVQVKDMKFYP